MSTRLKDLIPMLMCDDTQESILVLAPDDEAARKELGHKRGKDGRWSDPGKTRRPRDHNDEALPEFEQQRRQIVDRLRSVLLEAAESAELPATERRPVFEDLLKLDPNDADTHLLLGEGLREGSWVLLEVLRSDERRVELAASVAEAFAKPVTSTPGTADPPPLNDAPPPTPRWE